MVCLEQFLQHTTEGRDVFLAGMCGHKLNLMAKIRAAIFHDVHVITHDVSNDMISCTKHEIMSFVTRPRSQPMSVFVANEYLELTQLRLKLRKPNGDISFKK